MLKRRHGLKNMMHLCEYNLIKAEVLSLEVQITMVNF